jgi:membrane associated rhomboid family serine protease
LTGNTSAFLPLAWFVMLQGIHAFYVVTIGTVLGSGILTWLLGREKTYYVGASDLIYGYLGFLLIYGIIAANGIALLLAVISIYLYGKLLTGYTIRSGSKEFTASSGILPNSDVPNLAWESHLFGFVVGGLLAYLLGMMKLDHY